MGLGDISMKKITWAQNVVPSAHADDTIQHPSYSTKLEISLTYS